MFGISMWELLLVGLILFLVVGPSKLPGLAKQLGNGIKDLRRSLNDIKGSVDKDDEFVKAVRSAKQSVAEAKEAVRSIFDDDGEYPEPEPEDDLKPPHKRLPTGRKMVKAADGEAKDATSTDKEPVEEELWRADGEASDPAPETPSDSVSAKDPSSWSPVAESAPGSVAPPSWSPTARRPKKPRRMVRPGRSRDEEVDD